MSQDLIFGFTKKDWSRNPSGIGRKCLITRQKEPLTDDERAKLERLAKVKMKAESGSKPAQRQWREITAKVNALRSRARKGDPRARHTLGILEDSGLFGRVQVISGSTEPKDQDIIDKLIMRAGENSGWPVYISTSRYADYKGRAAKGDSRATEVITILNRYVKDGKLKIGDEKKSDIVRYPIGNHDELAAARDGGACERAAMSRTQGIVISDAEIKANMQGRIALMEGQGSYPRQRRRHHRHRRSMYQQPGQVPGQYPSQYPGQQPSTYVASRDSQKSQIVRSLYSQIKREHINWMTNQDLQNGITNQTADRYQQAARAWARTQLQQQQLPTRYTASGANQWQQPVSWFQSQAQAVLNNTASQRATQINATATTATTTVPYSSYPYTAAPAPIPASSSPANVYYPSSSSQSSYPAPGTDSTDDPAIYDDDQQGWPSPLLMHGSSFVGDESRAEGENSTSCGDGLPHNQYRALVMRQAIKNAGGKAPGTKHLFMAKKSVDNALGASGVSIYIPGSGPMRRTV
jgi:hypothetical protein